MEPQAEPWVIQYFFDQDGAGAKDDAGAACVQWSITYPDLLEVRCPVGTHIRRRRYIRVLGTALSRHRSARRVAFVPPQVNGVVALGCLGFFLRPHQAPGTFTLSRNWPIPTLVPNLMPEEWQFRTLWHENGPGLGGAFRSSYFDMVAGAFRWAWRDSPFKSAVAALKTRKALVLRATDWDSIAAHIPATTEVYGEYAVAPALVASFFGTIGDVNGKRALLPHGSPGRRALDEMRVYFLDPKKPVALAVYLNARLGHAAPQLDAARDLHGLPETALGNFAKIWTPEMLPLVRALVLKTPELAKSIIHHVPFHVRDYVRPPAGPHAEDTDAVVLAVLKSIALYPDLAPKVLLHQ